MNGSIEGVSPEQILTWIQPQKQSPTLAAFWCFRGRPSRRGPILLTLLRGAEAVSHNRFPPGCFIERLGLKAFACQGVTAPSSSNLGGLDAGDSCGVMVEIESGGSGGNVAAVGYCLGGQYVCVH